MRLALLWFGGACIREVLHFLWGLRVCGFSFPTHAVVISFSGSILSLSLSHTHTHTLILARVHEVTSQALADMNMSTVDVGEASGTLPGSLSLSNSILDF